MSTTFSTSSPGQTKKIGKMLAKDILRSGMCKKAYAAHRATGPNRAAVLGLIGDLGGGKTTFLQGFAKGLGLREKILSPTFIVIRRIKNFYHIDCYRIKKSEELLSLGFKKIISNPRNIVVVEWADLIKEIMPPKTIWINFKFINSKTRKIVIRYK